MCTSEIILIILFLNLIYDARVLISPNNFKKECDGEQSYDYRDYRSIIRLVYHKQTGS